MRIVMRGGLQGLLWTESEVAEVVRLHRAGFSAWEISQHFCQSKSLTDRSRSAVLGKLFRLGFGSERRSEKKFQIQQQPKQTQRSDFLPAPEVRRGLVGKTGGLCCVDELTEDSSDNVKAGKRGVLARGSLVAFERLGHDMCRWPMAGSGAALLYCGRPAARGKAYCVCHGSKARRAKKGAV